MEWIPCKERVGTLGAREGHCATCLLDPATGEEWVMCVGGYCEGERDGIVMISKVFPQPVLCWITVAEHLPCFECDGASLTRVGNPTEAYMFGGLDANLNRCNRLFRVGLDFTDRLPTLDVKDLQTTGSIPPPRTQHSAGGTATYLFVFGGEKDGADQSNDMYMLDTVTLLWKCIKTEAPVPPPRLLAGPLLFISSHVCVLYGGAHFVNGDIKSLNDVWFCDLSSACTWTQLEVNVADENVVFPRSNGHAGGLFREEEKVTAVFVGGKDAVEGCDKVKQVCWCKSGEGLLQLRLVEPTLRCREGPHWRYTPAVVETHQGILLLGGQCRHPQDVVAFYLKCVGGMGSL
ncbi:putative Galactose oxidase, central domain containing protein [Trypanosoma cruzi]|uniref:Uncharacterized protein n=1 Tax=Trypanosoma cruzi TaxID=5693 RepID=A0A7J6Y1U8_TRYCR|nr:hypothetical protein ECC02_006306 [Trypanosoma cruzi]KAF8275831.1 putative Galactose oxidase, central domain containing protein [Trypanosoma cruzi]